MVIKDCHKCDISTFRKNIVNGDGSVDVSMIIIGDNPGYNEDKLGKPFIGKAGLFLIKSLHTVGFKKKWFYLTNIIKCKPLGSDKPTLTQIINCAPYLVKEINTIKPKIIFCLGTISLSAIMGVRLPISKHRGQVFFKNGSLIIATYHPNYILINPEQEDMFMKDIVSLAKLYKTFINPLFQIKK